MAFKNYFCLTRSSTIKKRLLVVGILFTSATLNAQTENLNQLLERGEKSYPFLKSKEAELFSSAEQVDAAQNEYLPDLIIGHQYTYSTANNVEGSFLSNGGTTINPSGGIHPDNIYIGTFGSLTSALFNWEIVNFGKVTASVNSAIAENEKNAADYENEVFRYKIRVADNYLLLLASQYLTKVQKNNLERAAVFVNAIRAQVIADLRPGVDSSLANAEYVKAKLLLLESEKNEKIYRYRLAELVIGLPDSANIDPMNFFTDLPIAFLPQSDSSPISPILKLYQSSIDLSNARSIAIRRLFYPTVSFTGAVWARGSGIFNQDQSYHTDFLSGTRYQAFNYLLGLTVRWDLTSYMRINNSFKSEQFQLQRYQYLYQHQLNIQTREQSEAEMELAVSLEQAQLAPIQLQAARQAYAQAEARYESDLIDLPTYQQSLVTLSRAEADYYMAYANAWRSLLKKAAATGDLSLFLNQVN